MERGDLGFVLRNAPEEIGDVARTPELFFDSSVRALYALAELMRACEVKREFVLEVRHATTKPSLA
jgi:hypothetical protein